jgi:hypothetical protein
VGRPVTYSSGVRLPAAPGEVGQDARTVGLTVTLAAEQVQGSLVSVRLELSGAEFVDPERRRLEPFRREAIRTVPSGTPFDVSVEVPDAESGAGRDSGVVPVRYLVRVTPLLSP